MRKYHILPLSLLFIIMLAGLTSSLMSKVDVKDVLIRNVVRIAIGTGFVYRGEKDKYIITNFHVCYPMLAGQPEPVLYATTHNLRTIKSVVVKQDPDKDLCAAVIKEGTAIEGLTLRTDTRDTMLVHTLGFPEGVESYSVGNPGAYENVSVAYPEYQEMVDLNKLPCSSPHLRLAETLFGPVCIHTNPVRFINTYSMGGASGSPVVDSEAHLLGVVEIGSGASKTGGMITQSDVIAFVEGL